MADNETPAKTANSPNPPPQPAPPTEAQTDAAKLGELLLKLLDSTKRNQELLNAAAPVGFYGRLMQFSTSGVFFMLVGILFLLMAYLTIGHTFAAMSFVFVVVGVGILLFGTGTQGVGNIAYGRDPKSFFAYKIALAGGAGITAFCVAGGIIEFHDDMKRAFQIEQGYLRVDIYGNGLREEDIGHYLPEITVNGEAAPAVRRGRYVEVYLPYMLNDSNTFEIQAKLHLMDQTTSLLSTPEGIFKMTIKTGGEIVDDDEPHHHYNNPGGFDFPRYALRNTILLKDDPKPRDNLGGNAPR